MKQKKPKVGDRVTFNGHRGTVTEVELRPFVTIEFDNGVKPSPMSGIDATKTHPQERSNDLALGGSVQ